MRVMLTGAGGQLGRGLVESAPGFTELSAFGRTELDVTRAEDVTAWVGRLRPQVIINTAAYTEVDRAESQPEDAFKVNALAPRLLADAAVDASARLIHISTDFVFDGRQGVAYQPQDATNPLGVYGASKLAGENAVLDTLGEAALILRTAWVYSARGRNFFTTMVRLMRERETLAVVDDQVGTPTAVCSLVQLIWGLVENPSAHGILHWTDTGVASRFDFAMAIAEEAHAAGLLRQPVEIRPTRTADYPTAAQRPAFSVLDWRSASAVTGLVPQHWRSNLREVTKRVKVA